MKTLLILLFIASAIVTAQDPFAALQAHDDSLREARLHPAVEAPPVIDTTTYESDVVATDRVEIIISSTVIDSLQSIYDINFKSLYKDMLFAKSKNFVHSDKIRYMKYLLKYNLIDTMSVVEHAKLLLSTYDIRLKINRILLQTQDHNARTMIRAHIRKIVVEMADVTDYIVSLMPDNFKLSHKNEIK